MDHSFHEIWKPEHIIFLVQDSIIQEILLFFPIFYAHAIIVLRLRSTPFFLMCMCSSNWGSVFPPLVVDNPPFWSECSLVQTPALLAAMGGREAATVLWALATAGVRDTPLLEALTPRTVRSIHQMRDIFNAQFKIVTKWKRSFYENKLLFFLAKNPRIVFQFSNAIISPNYFVLRQTQSDFQFPIEI